MDPLAQVINPVALYVACAIGALGVGLSLPRKGLNPQVLGALIAALGGGVVVVALGLRSSGHLPNVHFYIFSAVSLGAALRVITHPKPVYAALYFILTVISTAGLFLILSAEFMAFALIIVYAGAILITYLFVIMMASQAPAEGEGERLAEYDTFSREPLAATLAGFLLLAALTTMLFRGASDLPMPKPSDADDLLADMPRKVESALREAGSLDGGRRLASAHDGLPMIDTWNRTAVVETLSGGRETVPLPADLRVTNIEGLGFDLLNDHPGTIEIAGVVLLMAMLGAVVLSRKQVEIDEEAKRRAAGRLAGGRP